MNGVLADLADREYSISRLLDHIDDVSEIRRKVDVIVVLKSSVFIALYNNIEATAYSAIERVHDRASSLFYDDLSDAFRIKMLRYAFGKTAGAYISDADKVADQEYRFRSMGQTFPEFSDYLRRQPLFSGNVDARKLNVIGISYGMEKIPFIKGDAERMLWVKNKRNKIAHGEQSMSDGGQGIKTLDLRRASTSVGVILREFICAVGTHLEAGSYRCMK
ncbi:MAE_28990/MAE_18760 family HEPN-like nuclease [Burkholderia sp. S-53]|uniref:MAE_28990/MAE_18760 family HEPN-like nuclease n=1 Tax=Burkholderia sp. S-53 TaxID=2906514 RepID=UPI0021CFEDEE|nr:MAE_28990/MAE_18760 family HEPN-like nuclease [Burkholderia sp. S-53]UXU90351.1 hypothetical protein LXM88_34185 [Burkholderia sp. S-53]